MNTDIEKIQKSSNAALIVARICKIFCIAMATLLIIIGILFVGFLNDYLNEGLNEALQSGESMPELYDRGMLFRVANQFVQPGDNHAATLGIDLIIEGVTLVILAVLMHFISKIFKDIKEGYSPFQPSIVKNMKIAFVIITLISLDSSLLIGALIGFSLWCVICIFSYGCKLQKESDETL